MSLQLPTIYPVTCHTDHVGLGTTFVAIQGFREDGSDYIEVAINRGARCIVVHEAATFSSALQDCLNTYEVNVVRVADTRRALAELSSKAWGYPAQQLNIIGITGTVGKSTTTFLVEHLLRAQGIKTALLSSVQNKIGDQNFEATLTTAQPDYLHMFFAQCLKEGVSYVVMEVAAQALSLGRVQGLEFVGGIFTNFSPEHGEFYVTAQDYFAAKISFINHLKPDAPLILNADDQRLTSVPMLTIKKVLVGSSLTAQHHLTLCMSNLEKMVFEVETESLLVSFESAIAIGHFSMYNMGMAVSLVHELGFSWESLQKGVTLFKGVPGRLERYTTPCGALVFIDYAYNPASIESLLKTLRPYTQHLMVVSGAGGDRDRERRPRMGDIMSIIADEVILTTDNPRFEDPKVIVQDIYKGVAPDNISKVSIELDREKAIRIAYTHAKKGTIIALLGKGPDEYQIIENKKIFFSERSIVATFL
jgi:UDP-N-acetylmuramoyl-L-alanyl-D-glutamate--2,6-diaminopimelate ligase